MKKQYTFKYEATNDESKHTGSFTSSCTEYGKAYDELTDHLINLFDTGFKLKIINIIVNYGHRD
jgi:hypothetical protein